MPAHNYSYMKPSNLNNMKTALRSTKTYRYAMIGNNEGILKKGMNTLGLETFYFFQKGRNTNNTADYVITIMNNTVRLIRVPPNGTAPTNRIVLHSNNNKNWPKFRANVARAA